MNELATLMRDIDPKFGRMRSVSNEVRTKLAFAYVTANRMIDAEFLAHGVSDALDDGNFKLTSKIKTDWQSVPYLKEMIARTDQRTTVRREGEVDAQEPRRSHDRVRRDREGRRREGRAGGAPAKEQNARPNDFIDARMMIPKTWFPIFKKFSNTKYYKEVLAECGRFRNWVDGN